GYDVVLVGSGPAALAALEQEGADVLLTDLYMPEMTGWDLTRVVRARGIAGTRGRPLCVGLYSAVLSGVSRALLARAPVDFTITRSSVRGCAASSPPTRRSRSSARPVTGAARSISPSGCGPTWW